jgi:signal transduction histidine kinase
MDRQLYKNITDSLPYAILVLGEGLRVVKVNRSCEILLSKTEVEILGSDLSEIIPHRELRSQAEAVLQSGGTKLVEIHLDDEIPRILRAIVTALDVAGQSGNVLCLITLEDISERARLEDQLVQSEKLAGMGLLASTVAHELGNPLSIMSSTLQYIRDTILNAGKPEDQEAGQPVLEFGDPRAGIVDAIETIMDSVEQMHELLRTLSGFTGSQRPQFEPTDLRRVLSQMLAFIHKEAEAHRIKVYHQFDNHLPDCQVDLREIKQLFLNLLKNAIEAMPDGGELRVTMYLVEGKDAVCVDISDTGHGISETELRSIFRPFYSTKADGTGLGLPFCRRVAEEHGGEIGVESQLHKGSTFSVILPVRQEKI